LVEDLRAHKPEAIEELLAEHGRQIHAVAYLVLRSAADAEEVVMDTVMTAWDKAGSIRQADALRPWLLQIATRRSLSMARGRRPTGSLEPGTGGWVDPIGPVANRLALASAVAALPVRMRAAIALRYYADLDLDAIARALGRSRNTVKTELRLALGRLRQQMDADAPVPHGREQIDAT
jgi:RNA polymerase sigma-70 factor (ECF subfamily)